MTKKVTPAAPPAAKQATKAKVAPTTAIAVPPAHPLPVLAKNTKVFSVLDDSLEVTRVAVSQEAMAKVQDDSREVLVRCLSLVAMERGQLLQVRYALGREIIPLVEKYKDGGIQALCEAMNTATPEHPIGRDVLYNAYKFAGTYTPNQVATLIKEGWAWNKVVLLLRVEEPKARRELQQAAVKHDWTIECLRSSVQELTAKPAPAAATAVTVSPTLAKALQQLDQRATQLESVTTNVGQKLETELTRLREADPKTWAGTVIPKLRLMREQLEHTAMVAEQCLPVIDEMLRTPDEIAAVSETDPLDYEDGQLAEEETEEAVAPATPARVAATGAAATTTVRRERPSRQA